MIAADAAAAQATATMQAKMQTAAAAQAAANEAMLRAELASDAALAVSATAAQAQLDAQADMAAASAASAAADTAMQAQSDAVAALLLLIDMGAMGDPTGFNNAVAIAVNAATAATVAQRAADDAMAIADASAADAQAAQDAAATANAAAEDAQAAASTAQLAADNAMTLAIDAQADADAAADAHALAVIASGTANEELATATTIAQQATDAASAANVLAEQAAQAQAAADAIAAASQQAAEDAEAVVAAAELAADSVSGELNAAQAALNQARVDVTNATSTLASSQLALQLAEATLTLAQATTVSATTDAASASSGAATAAATADGSATALLAAEASVLAAQASVDTAAATAQSIAQALVAAQLAIAGEPDTVVVDSMKDIMTEVFAGGINPGELSINRTISDHDPEGSTDTAAYDGNIADYAIEGTVDALGVVTPADIFGGPDGLGGPDGFIEVVDLRLNPVPGLNEGRDLVRNVERLSFADGVVLIPFGAAGSGPEPGVASAEPNSVATGRPAIERCTDATCTASEAIPAGTEVELSPPGGEPTLVRGVIGSLMDLDGLDPTKVTYRWESELMPNVGGFGPITRLAGLMGVGDPFAITGPSMELTIAEAALRVRVVAVFKDDAGVFEIARSEPIRVANCPGCPTPANLIGILPASFVGDAAAFAADFRDGVAFLNDSRPGDPRISVTIPGVPLDLFENTGFGNVPGGGDIIEPGDVISVGNFALTFTDSDGNVTGEIGAQIAAIANVDALGFPDGTARQDAVDLIFFIRGEPVLPLIVPPATTASVSVDGVEVANATFVGDSSVNTAVGVVIELVNGAPAPNPALVALPSAAFNGLAADIDGTTVTFLNDSRPGQARFEVTVPAVDIDLFGGVNGLDPAFSGGITPGCGPLPQVCPGDEIPVGDSSFELVFTTITLGVETGRVTPVITAIANLGAGGLADGTARQDAVDVFFSLRDADVAPLINGLTNVSVLVNGTAVAEVVFFGNSTLNSALDVLVLTTQAEIEAAAALQVAEILGDAAGIAEAQAALNAAIAAAPNPGLPLVPTAAFNGAAAAIDGAAVTFVNDSRPDQARFEVTVPAVDIDLFGGVNGLDPAFSAAATAGCGPLPEVCPGDGIPVGDGSFQLTFTTADGISGRFTPDIVAVDNLGAGGLPDGTARQDVVDVLFSIRGADVSPLFNGLTSVSLTVAGVEVATASFFGDSRVNQAQDLIALATDAQVNAAAELQIAQILNQMGPSEANAAAVADAQAALDEALAAAPPAPEAVPTANFTGTLDDLTGLSISFANDSRVDGARFEITITDVPRAAFTNTGDAFGDTGAGTGEAPGCGPAAPPAGSGVSEICPGDAIAVDSFEFTFFDNLGDPIRTFGSETVQIGAQDVFGIDGVTVTGASQEVVGVLWSIRGDDVTGPPALVQSPGGFATANVVVDGAVTELASFDLVGDSGIDPLGVAIDATELSSGLVDGLLTAVDTTGVGSADPLPSFSGIVDNRGRIRIGGVCPAGNASAPGLECRTTTEGIFVCRGRSLDAGDEIFVTCTGDAAQASDQLGFPTAPDTAATGAADSRGRVVLSGSCEAGQSAWMEGERCRTKSDGSFRCRASRLAPFAPVSVSCQ